MCIYTGLRPGHCHRFGMRLAGPHAAQDRPVENGRGE